MPRPASEGVALFVWGEGCARPALPHDVTRIQRFLEENPEYARAVEGRAVPPHYAREWLDSVPPADMPYGRINNLGLETQNGELIGIASIVEDLLAPGVWHIGLYIIATRHHGSGLAHAVLDALHDWAIHSGAHWMRLGVLVGNERAVRFWQASGYQIVRRRVEPDFYGRRVEFLVMVRAIDRSIDEYLLAVPRDRVDPGAA